MNFTLLFFMPVEASLINSLHRGTEKLIEFTQLQLIYD